MLSIHRRQSTRMMASLALAIAATVTLGASAPAFSQSPQPVTWRFAHTTPIPGTVWHKYATEVLPQRISDASGGLVKVQVVSGIVQPADMLAGIRDGQIQGGSLLFPYVGPTLPLWNVLSLPGLVEDDATYPALMNKVVRPVVEEDALRRYKAQPVVLAAITGLYFFSNGPIDSLAKIKGMKYRTSGTELVQLVQAAGGTAVSMPFGELHGALQRKMVDAYTSAVGPAMSAKLYEVSKYAENWPTGVGPWGYFVSAEAMSKLPPDVQAKLNREFAKLQTEVQAATVEEAAVTIKGLKEKGMVFVNVPAAERAQATKLAEEKIWAPWVKVTGQPGQEMLNKVRAAK